ncbi:MAG: flavin reductase, partial [Burkholderiaceae bacterium]|nr:flavin reductase [Burkholderiaceae bacterium]
GCFPTGVAVITTLDARGEPLAMTVNSFSSVSLEPALVLWSLRNNSSSVNDFVQSSGFAVNVLSDGQDGISGHFATSGNARKFDGLAHTRGHLGMPLIEGCLARFECSNFARHPAGDHMIFIGRVEAFDYGHADEPLVFHRGSYMMLTQSLRILLKRGRVEPPALSEARTRIYEMLLRIACESGADADFDAIEAAINDMEAAVVRGDMLQRGKAGIEFFRRLADAAHNEVLSMLVQSINALLNQTLLARVATTPSLHHLPELAPIRREILRELRVRNADAAVAAIDRYMQIAGPGIDIAR